MAARLLSVVALLAMSTPTPVLQQRAAKLQLPLLDQLAGESQQAPVVALPDDPAATAADRQFIQRSYELARQAVKEGNSPFGAVLVVDGKIVAEYRNSVASSHDPTRHAELGLISTFYSKLGREAFRRGTLYASSEPCVMCIGAILHAGVLRVVYGTTEAQFQRIIGDQFGGHDKKGSLNSREIVARTNPTVRVLGPVLEKEGLAIHQSYWPKVIKTWGRG
ncbi:MAG: nucleoside deaminase [Prochlorococcaceae cyanobacterium]|jgi:tRNA(Arg) A34 adenosine deaminase TadA